MNKNIIEMLKLYKPSWIYFHNKLKFYLFPFKKIETFISKKGFIVDLGCGYGLLANLLGLTSDFRDVLGLEINKNKIKYANIGIKNTKFVEGDITKIDIPQADHIIFTHVLHHLISYKAQEILLKACYDKLKPAGSLIILEVGRSPKWKFLLSSLADRILYPFEKINFRSVEDLKSQLNKCKFDVEVIPIDKGSLFSHILFVAKKT